MGTIDRSERMRTITAWTSEYGQSVYGENKYGEKIVSSVQFLKNPIKLSFSKNVKVSFEKDTINVSFKKDVETSFKKAKRNRSFK